MIKKAGITCFDLVLDIGAGKGAITFPLANKARHVVAIEQDPELVLKLKKSLGNRDNINVLNMDIRKVPLPNQSFKVVANIPFGITTDIFGKLMDSPDSNFESGVINIEWGAALKLTKANQASPRHVYWSTFYEMDIIQKVSKDAFHPPPAVDSALLKIEKRENPTVSSSQQRIYFAFLATMLTPHGVLAKKALRKIFTKTQVKRLIIDAGISKQALIQHLDVWQWEHCFQTMLNLIPESEYPISSK